MIGADTTFLIELDLLEHPRHAAAHETLRREVLDSGHPLVLAPQVLAEFVLIVTEPAAVRQAADDRTGAGAGGVLVERRRGPACVPHGGVDARIP